MEQHLFSPNSAARALDVSRSKVYDLMKRGLLHYVVIESDRRIPASEIARIAAEGIPAKSEQA
ncbi:helix-turn-helix domain-containing protein [Pseudomonas sp. R-28-1W-6]|uniref:helix-turn-helix domain-containing protein n=1 Tax=Pseudomonas sp. R-28-1W-6 TaxID=2650101 RepID=UPI0013658578|nr:helix-turn-helix domain-containing protein [Pseudomonas sp. R-28-1W-6]MWV11160.1 helix-turn-helix domain-containing protein [Pseudomonas sp. R-28-1W-6]